MAERYFQADVIKHLRRMFPGCIILKNDANYLQGVPDLLILWFNKWAALEVKTGSTAPLTPNQRHYVDTMSEMSFAAFIYPANKEQVLGELQRAFGASRKTRVSKPK